MPGFSFLGWGRPPAPEAVANSGPAVTYPAPPNANSTPQSIASIAGGTTIPDLEIDDGEITTQHFAANPLSSSSQDASSSQAASGATSSVTNLAAARANGFESMAASAAGATPTTESYTFGDRALTPKSNTAAAFATQVAPQTPTGDQASSTTRGHGFAPPSSNVAGETASTTVPASGFMLPTDSPSFANLTPSSEQVSEQTSQPSVTDPAAADFSTANRVSGFSTSISDRVLPAAEMNTTDDAGYSPGSTASGLSYPSDRSKPTTSGSFFR